jgi:hypothetical protein
MRTCPNCGRENHDRATFCGKCFIAFPPLASTGQRTKRYGNIRTEEDTKAKVRMWIGIVAGSVCMFFIVVGGISKRLEQSDLQHLMTAQATIQGVIDRYSEILKKNRLAGNDELFKGFDSIPLQNCPEDFKTAWVGYLRSVEQNRPDEKIQSAISEVIAQYSALTANRQHLSGEALFREYAGISVRDCPPDFTAAWDDYLKSLEPGREGSREAAFDVLEAVCHKYQVRVRKVEPPKESASNQMAGSANSPTNGIHPDMEDPRENAFKALQTVCNKYKVLVWKYNRFEFEPYAHNWTAPSTNSP